MSFSEATAALSKLESVRRFEFDFTLRCLEAIPAPTAFLDASSPRLLPLLIKDLFPECRGLVINPDRKDLDQTMHMLRGIPGLEFDCVPIDRLSQRNEQYDLVTSMSVVEHIPDEEDSAAIGVLWRALATGGSLLLTVPCAREAFDEYIDFNEYGLLPADENGFVFGQRFYDERALETRIFDACARPNRMAFFGERTAGSFFDERLRQFAGTATPCWREGQTTRASYQEFDRLEDMPGIGVCCMHFVKHD